MSKQRREPATQKRVIRVFVSSTFRDMQEEREELVKRVFPQLRKLCESRGVIWGEVDLRWGVTNEQKADGKVLPICLAEIERSRPYFIGLLGERYGWVPDEIDDALVEQEPWLSEHLGKSVTELEILHGVLNDPQMAEHAFFYLRDPAYADSLPAEQYKELAAPEEIAEFGPEKAERRAEERRARLKALKGEIRASGFPVRENYSNPRALGELVLSDLTTVIDSLYPSGSEPDPLTREAAEHEAFARSRVGVYIGRSEYTKRLNAHAKGDESPLVVLGESGSGKSALLANWALSYREKHPDELVLLHFVGASPASTDWASMLRRIIGELARRFEFELEIPDSPDQLRLAFARALHMAAAKGRVVLVLDALNQLEDREGALDLVWLPPEIPANVCMIISTLPGRPLDDLGRRSWQTLQVKPLERAKRERLIVEYLAQYTKALDKPREKRIASAEQTANPLFLRALLEELRLWGEHETLDRAIDRCLEARNPTELYEKILERYEADYERDRPGLVEEAMTLVWAARRGLAETELLDLLGEDGDPLPRAYWAPLFLAAESSLTSRSGLLGFFHDYLRAAVEHRYLEDDEAKKVAHLHLADYFATREIGPRKVEELPRQLAQALAWERLVQLLTDLAFLDAAWSSSKFEVKAVWAEVENKSQLRLLDAYQPVLDKPRNCSNTGISVTATLLCDTGYVEQAVSLQAYLVENVRGSDDLENLGRMLGNQAGMLAQIGELDRATALRNEEELICRDTGDRAGLAASLVGQSNIRRLRDDAEGALELATEAEHIFRDLGDQSGLAASLGAQAVYYFGRSELDRALVLNQERERICREQGDLGGLQFALRQAALISSVRGDRQGAMSIYKEQEGICRTLGDREGLASSLGAQGLVLKDLGDLEGALSAHMEQERIVRELHLPFGLASCLCMQSILLERMGRQEAALINAQEACRLADQYGMTALAKVIQSVLDRLQAPASSELATSEIPKDTFRIIFSYLCPMCEEMVTFPEDVSRVAAFVSEVMVDQCPTCGVAIVLDMRSDRVRVEAHPDPDDLLRRTNAMKEELGGKSEIAATTRVRTGPPSRPPRARRHWFRR